MVAAVIVAVLMLFVTTAYVSVLQAMLTVIMTGVMVVNVIPVVMVQVV